MDWSLVWQAIAWLAQWLLLELCGPQIAEGFAAVATGIIETICLVGGGVLGLVVLTAVVLVALLRMANQATAADDPSGCR